MNDTGPATVNLYSRLFWVTVGLACLVLVPITQPRAVGAILATINLGMIAGLLNFDVAYVLGSVFIAWVILILSAGRSSVALLGAVIALGLFVVHKRPDAAAALGLAAGLNPILKAVGASYVFLRFVEVLRAVREGRHPAPSLDATINYLLPFHMLAAGPIQSYDDFVGQPAVPPAPTTREALGAFERIAIGLFKKFFLAELISRIFLTGFRVPGPYFVVEIQLNYLWLFLDFSAYSDVSIGVGRLIGVATPENFNRPYLARNPVNFWERWHISLSQFIRRNVFFPIQFAMLRKTEGRSVIAVSLVSFLVSFGLCGLWHSLSKDWLVWGLYQAVGLFGCTVYTRFLLKRMGRQGLNAYMANPWIKVVAVVAMFEFAAIGVLIVTYPFLEVLRWSSPSK